MRVIRHVAEVGPATRPRVVAAGEFDGLHRGHQRLLARVVERAAAERGESLVVVEPRPTQPQLTDLRQRLEGFRAAGIEVVVFAGAHTIDDAVARVHAAIRVAGVGEQLSAPVRGALEQVALVTHGGAAISAGAIRAALAAGDLDSARALLGRDAGVGGRVVHGFHRGAPLGVPTANLRVRGMQLPPDGVYAVRARIGGTALHGVANIGFNPTFGNQTRTVETHLFDFSGDVYGRRLEIGFAARLRGEQKFPDVAALLAQIRADIAAARRVFAS